MNKRHYPHPAPKRMPWPKGGPPPPIKKQRRPQRNEQCPCLSGKKFKHCCKDVSTLISTLKVLVEEEEKNEDRD